jgi:predicted  nucleic acid-binding Zn ribbon protein
MTDQDMRSCPTCHSDENVKLMQPVLDGLMFKCVQCHRIWSVFFHDRQRPRFDPRPEA